MMIFRKRYFTALWLKSFANHLPLTLLIGLRTAVTVFFGGTASVSDVTCSKLADCTCSGTGNSLAVPFRLAGGPLFGNGSAILANFNEKKLQELRNDENGKVHNWLDEQLQIASYICTRDSAAADKELKDLQWGKIMQVNVIKIIRGRKHINIPEGDEQILVGDRLYILGTEKALENFALMNQQRIFYWKARMILSRCISLLPIRINGPRNSSCLLMRSL